MVVRIKMFSREKKRRLGVHVPLSEHLEQAINFGTSSTNSKHRTRSTLLDSSKKTCYNLGIDVDNVLNCDN